MNRPTSSDPLADLIREILERERCYAVKGNEWYGWWTGRLPHDRQLFVAFGGRGVYSSRRDRMTNPEFADPNSGRPTIFLALFDPSGVLLEILSRPDPLKIDPRTRTRHGVGAIFDVDELEAYLRSSFGGFERQTIRAKPFRIPEIGLVLDPLIALDADYLENPESYADEDERERVRRWAEAAYSLLNYGNDYWLDDDGHVESS